MKVKLYKLNWRRFLLILLMFPYFEPASVTGTVELFYNTCKVISCCFVLFIVLEYIKKKEEIILYIGAWLMTTLLSSYVNAGNIYSSFVYVITCLGWSILVIYCGCLWEKKDFFIAYLFLMDLLYVINLGSIIINRAVGDNFFMGHNDAYIWRYIPMIVVSRLLEMEDMDNKVTSITWFQIVLATLTMTISYSPSGLLTLVFFPVVYILFTKTSISYWQALFFILAMNIGMLMFNVHYLFSFFIEKILKRSVSLTGRDLIWQQVKSYIVAKPILGYGKSLDKQLFVLKKNYYVFVHSHNEFLQLLWETGIVGTALFFLLLYKVCQKLNSSRTRESAIIMAGIIAELFALLINASTMPLELLLLFIMGYFVKGDMVGRHRN